jgi:hypothetical protein
VAIVFKLAFGSVKVYAVEREWDNWIMSLWKEKCLSMPFVPSLEKFQNHHINSKDRYDACLSYFKKYDHHTNSIEFEDDGAHVNQVINDIFNVNLIMDSMKENKSTDSLWTHNIARYYNSILFVFWYPLELLETHISLCIELTNIRLLKSIFIVFRILLRLINPRKNLRKLLRINPA